MSAYIKLVLAFAWLVAWTALFRQAEKRSARGEYVTLREMPPFPWDPLAWGNPGGCRLIELWGGWEALPYVEKKREAIRVLVDPLSVEKCLHQAECRVWRDVFLLLPLAAPLGIGAPKGLIFWMAFILLRIGGSLYSVKRKAHQREREIERALGDVLTRLILALHAGALPVSAWQAVAEEGDSPLHHEMRRVMERVDSGEALRLAASRLSHRFHVEGLSDMVQLFTQSLELGGVELAEGLERIRTRLYAERTRRYVIEAERASQRMMFPSLVLFVGILLLVMTPVIGR